MVVRLSYDTAIFESVWLLTLAACVLFFVYSTAHYIYSAWLLYHYKAELQRRVNELKELLSQVGEEN